MSIKNYDEVSETLQEYLCDYLESQGIDTSTNFKCISPSHDDKNPSMGIAPSKKVFHCFSCGVSGNIFTARHWLEGKPIVGTEFLLENMVPIAKEYGVDVELETLTEEKAYELDTYRAYRAAADYVTNSNRSKIFNEAIKDRKWNESICKEYGVGCIPDFKIFRETLKRVGFAASFLDDIDLGRKEIFGEDRLIFTIRDHKERPVGFSSRNLGYTDDKKNGAKYVNQRGTGVKCNIYKKSTRLFGLDVAIKDRKLTKEPNKPIYVFEGYADVVTAGNAGIRNACAVASSTLTIEQLHLLKDYNYYNIILCFDGDAPGQQRTEAMLDTVLSGHKDLKINIIMLPEGKDPDDFIREYGADAFKKLKKWDAFEWRLARFNENAEAEEIANSMLPLIVNESNYVRQEKMCEALSNATGITIKTIQHELERLQNLKSNQQARDREHILEKMMQNIKRAPEDAEYAMREAENCLFDLSKQHNDDAFSEEACLAELDMAKQQEEQKDGSFSGFRLGPALANMEKALNGEWRRGVWLCLGGKPNSGKTSFLANMARAIASIEENNACVIYHSIDDTIEQIRPKFISSAEGSRQLTLNEITDPNYHIANAYNGAAKEISLRRDTGYAIIRQLIKEGRLILKDANQGSSLAFADRLVRYYKTKYPDRNIIYILDNFHKLQDFASAKNDERSRFKQLSTAVKDLATKHGIAIITTVEYRKVDTGKKASNADVSETIQIEYDANLIGHVHNELHDKRNKAKLYHMENVDGELIQCPTIEVEVGKNKITGFKGSLYFDFYPHCSDFEAVPVEVIRDRLGEKEEEDHVDEKTQHLV